MSETWPPEEQWAAAVMAAALGPGVDVRQFDDGRRPGMHDLDLFRGNERFGAAEVTSATDPQLMELWKLIKQPGQRWIDPELEGGWLVALKPCARAKAVRTELPTILRGCEAEGVQELGSSDHRWPGLIDAAADRLGVGHAGQLDTDYPGTIYLTVDLPEDQSGGVVADDGNALPRWLDGWVVNPVRADNLRKLTRSGAIERHLMVIVRGLSGVPFAVEDLLLRRDAPLPTVAPTMPTDITHIWVMSGWNSPHGFRWHGDGGWSRFSKLNDLSQGRRQR